MFGMGTGVTLSTQPPENFSKEQRTLIFVLCSLNSRRELKDAGAPNENQSTKHEARSTIFFGSGDLGVGGQLLARPTGRVRATELKIE